MSGRDGPDRLADPGSIDARPDCLDDAGRLHAYLGGHDGADEILTRPKEVFDPVDAEALHAEAHFSLARLRHGHLVELETPSNFVKLNDVRCVL
jgi:hypothetical protein